MNEVREKLRTMLTRQERELDDWLYELANIIPVSDEQLVMESAGFGLHFRCMAIASIHPDWTYFRVLADARRSCYKKEQVRDMLFKGRRM